jgi:hypothetical protein
MPSSATATVREPWVTRESMGLAIIFIGQPLGWAIRGAEGSDSQIYPVAALFVGLAFMVRSHWLLAPKIHCDPVLLAIPSLLMLLPFMLLSLVHFRENLQSGLYPAFLIVVGLSIALTPQSKFDTLPRAVLIIGLLSSLDPFVQQLLSNSLDQAATQLTGRLQLAGNSNVLLTGSVGSVTMISAILVGDEENGKNPLVALLAAIAFTVGLGALVMSDKRSDELIMFPLAALYGLLRLRRERAPAKQGGGRQRLIFASLLVGGIAALPVLATIFFSKFALLAFEATSETRQSGFLNSLSGGSYVADASTNGRLTAIEFTYKHLDFVGHGMMHQQLVQGNGIYTHLIYLQAFYDLGIVGGFLFMIVAAFIPVALAILRVAKAPLKSKDMLVVLLIFYIQADYMTHGAPYSWLDLVPPLLCYLLLFGNQQTALEESQNAGDAVDAPAA